MKKPKFNNARAIIVLAQQKRWATCGRLRQRLSSRVSNVNFLPHFCCRGEAGVAFRRKMSDAQNSECSTLNVPLSFRCASVAR